MAAVFLPKLPSAARAFVRLAGEIAGPNGSAVAQAIVSRVARRYGLWRAPHGEIHHLEPGQHLGAICRLARYSGCGRRAVDTVLKRLEAAGLIEVERRPRRFTKITVKPLHIPATEDDLPLWACVRAERERAEAEARRQRRAARRARKRKKPLPLWKKFLLDPRKQARTEVQFEAIRGPAERLARRLGSSPSEDDGNVLGALAAAHAGILAESDIGDAAQAVEALRPARSRRYFWAVLDERCRRLYGRTAAELVREVRVVGPDGRWPRRILLEPRTMNTKWESSHSPSSSTDRRSPELQKKRAARTCKPPQPPTIEALAERKKELLAQLERLENG